MAANDLTIWVVYDHPKDYPTSYVARRFVGEQPTGAAFVSQDLERLRDIMEGMDLVKLMRMPGDDPVILETWL
jgi:hypothetical protein